MKKNVGGADQKIRFTLGGALLLGAALAPVDVVWRVVMLVVAAIALITAFTGL